MKKFVILIVLSVLMCSCTNNTIQEILFKPNIDPIFDSPIVDSFSSTDFIEITWAEDKGADVYYLMKKEDNSLGKYICIYEGNNTSFNDYDIEPGKRYIYKVDKKRGKIIFESDEYGYGFAGDCIKDSYEDNNKIEKSTLLESDIDCNLFCASFKTNNHEIHDEDWFYIVIPPKRTACILILQENLEDATSGSTTDLCLQIYEHQSVVVAHNKEYTIQNTSNEVQKKYFKIFPNVSNLVKSDGSSTVINYRVSLTKIVK